MTFPPIRAQLQTEFLIGLRLRSRRQLSRPFYWYHGIVDSGMTMYPKSRGSRQMDRSVSNSSSSDPETSNSYSSSGNHIRTYFFLHEVSHHANTNRPGSSITRRILWFRRHSHRSRSMDNLVWNYLPTGERLLIHLEAEPNAITGDLIACSRQNQIPRAVSAIFRLRCLRSVCTDVA